MEGGLLAIVGVDGGVGQMEVGREQIPLLAQDAAQVGMDLGVLGELLQDALQVADGLVRLAANLVLPTDRTDDA